MQFDYANGFLLFVQGDTLLAQRLDLDEGELTGDAFPVASPVRQFAVSDNGVLVYREPLAVPTAPAAAPINELHWFDRAGTPAGVLAGPAALDNPRISPDGRRVAVDLMDAGNRDIWTIDASRGGPVRLTFDRSVDIAPIWSPDGNRLVFASARGGGVAVANGLYSRPASGAGAEELLYFARATKAVAPLQLTPDGKYLLFAIADLAQITSRGEIGASSSRASEPCRHFSPAQGVLAPRVYHPTIAGSVTRRTNRAAGSEPKWRADGRQLF